MKMVPSRELSARPGAIWKEVAGAGAVVVTRDGVPMGIITPTSAETLLEDMREVLYAKARQAVKAMRESARETGRSELTMEEIDREVREVRKSRKEK